MIRIIISDEFGQHGTDIRTSICNGYGSNISPSIKIVPYFGSAYIVAKDTPSVIAFIRSTPGVEGYVSQLGSLYPRIQSFFPLGNDNFIQLNIFNSWHPPVVIPSGAGDFIATAQNRNNTAYGNGLEFWDRDLLVDDSSDQSSFSNGYILGKLLRIKDTLNCDWWEARYRARMTAYRLEPNRQTHPWDLRNGYGRIDVNAAIAYSGIIEADPYLRNIIDTNCWSREFKISQESFIGAM